MERTKCPDITANCDEREIEGPESTLHPLNLGDLKFSVDAFLKENIISNRSPA